VSRKPSPLGPIASRRRASLAARALSSCTADELDRLLQGGPLPRLRARLARLAEDQRYEEAARLRDRVEALEQIVERLRNLERLRRLEVCLIAPMPEPGWRKAFFVCTGRVCAVRALPPEQARGSRSEPGWRSVRAPAMATTKTR
jgi:excinuclease UvrABC nuclease subunit